MSAIVIDSKSVKPIVVNGYIGSEPVPPTPPVDDRFVDMGLPSGNLWAKYNIGVDPTDLGTAAKWYGDMHSWACADDESSKSSFVWSNYKWKGSDSSHFIKYTSLNSSAESGTADNKSVVEQADDIVFQTFGAGAQVPSLTDWEELYENCTGEVKYAYEGISGLTVLVLTSKNNGNELILPMCNVSGKYTDYLPFFYPTNWKRGLAKSVSEDSYFLMFELETDGDDMNGYDWDLKSRYNGFYYRGIKKQS